MIHKSDRSRQNLVNDLIRLNELNQRYPPEKKHNPSNCEEDHQGKSFQTHSRYLKQHSEFHHSNLMIDSLVDI